MIRKALERGAGKLDEVKYWELNDFDEKPSRVLSIAGRD